MAASLKGSVVKLAVLLLGRFMSVISEALAIWRIGDRKIWSHAQEEAISHSWTDNTSDPFRSANANVSDLPLICRKYMESSSAYPKYSETVPRNVQKINSRTLFAQRNKIYLIYRDYSQHAHEPLIKRRKFNTAAFKLQQTRPSKSIDRSLVRSFVNAKNYANKPFSLLNIIIFQWNLY